MNSLNKEILTFIKRASKRIKTEFILNFGIVGIKYLLSLILSILIFSLFIVFPAVYKLSYLILALV